METLDKIDYIKSIKKLSDSTFINEQKNQKNLSNFDKNLKKGLNFNPKDEKKDDDDDENLELA